MNWSFALQPTWAVSLNNCPAVAFPLDITVAPAAGIVTLPQVMAFASGVSHP